jgi:predicted enzyme related to lactoylglutathione lyase
VDVLINIDVPDLARAETFYVSAFGFEVGRRFEGVVELLGAGAPLYLLEKPEGSATPGATRGYRRHWTPVHLDLVVDDVVAAVERAVQAGALLESPTRDAAWGRLAMLADPFGHGFCLLEFKGRGYDELL